MTVATFVQPDATTQTGSQYKANIDGGFAVHRRLAGPFAPHAPAGPVMRVALDPGHVFNGSAIVEVAAQTSTLLAAASSQPRVDRIVVDCASGAVLVLAGTAAPTPAPPAIPTGRMPIAQVRVDPGTTVITNDKITDERVWAPTIDAPVAVRTGLFSPTAGVLAAAANNAEVWRYENSILSLAGDTDTGVSRPGSNALAFVTAGLEAMRIDLQQRVLIGGTNTNGIAGANARLQVHDVGGVNAGLSLQRYGDDASGVLMTVFKSRGDTLYSHRAVANGDLVFALDIVGSDGASQVLRSASIRAIVDGDPAAGAVPMRLAFMTAASGNAVDRLIVDSLGNIVPGAAGLATTAVAGFQWIESGAGAPTGAPSPSYSNRVPLYYDRTNNRLYIHNGAWRSAAFA